MYLYTRTYSEIHVHVDLTVGTVQSICEIKLHVETYSKCITVIVSRSFIYRHWQEFCLSLLETMCRNNCIQSTCFNCRLPIVNTLTHSRGHIIFERLRSFFFSHWLDWPTTCTTAALVCAHSAMTMSGKVLWWSLHIFKLPLIKTKLSTVHVCKCKLQ